MVGQTSVANIQSPHYTPSYTNFVQQRTQASQFYNSNYSPCSSPSLNYSNTVSKGNSVSVSAPSSQCTDFSSASIFSSPFSSQANFSSCTVLGNNNSSTSSNNNNNSNSCDNNNFDFSATLKNSKTQIPQFESQEETNFASTDQSSLFHYPKISKSNSASTPKYTPSYSNFSYFSNNQIKYTSSQDTIDLCPERSPKLKKDCDVTSKSLKTFKDDSDINYNVGELQQILSKHGTKIKNNSETSQDLVTDSLLHFLQKKTHEKNPQENYSYDLGDISQILVSLSSKYKSEEVPGLKKKETNEDSKLMNDFLTKLLLEKEEKRFKSLDDKKKTGRKEVFDDFTNEFDERKNKRDAMSHYQEEKTHHKRSTNYADFNQWDFLNQQDIQNTNSHNRRGHFPFAGSSQAHSTGWNPMGMGMPRQTNPYYTNPHGHMMPAHAHSEYRYNQWNNPNHKTIPNIHNAHSQNTILPQSRMDMKHHHSDIANVVSDYGLPVGTSTDFSKLRNTARDIKLNTIPPDKSNRPGMHPDLSSATVRNTTLRMPSLSSLPKPVINNPLSDLQMLVTNHDNDNPPQKMDNYQQESVDLSAHSDATKNKENSVETTDNIVSENNIDRKDNTLSISVKQRQNCLGMNEIEEVNEKPVALTSKNVEKSSDTEISSSNKLNNLENKNVAIVSNVGNKSESTEKEMVKDDFSIEEPLKTNKIVDGFGKSKSEVIVPKNLESCVSELIEKAEKKEEQNSEKSTIKHSVNETSTPSNNKDDLLPVDQLKVEETNTTQPSKESTVTNTETVDESNGKRKSTDEQSSIVSKKICVEEESQVDKVVEAREDNPDTPTVSSTSAEVKPALSETSKKTPKKKQSKKSRGFRLSSGQSSSSETHFYSKKFNKNDSKKKVKKGLCEIDRRGPFLHVEGFKESPTSVTVINFPKAEDEDDKDKNSIKKQALNASRNKHHNELNYRGKAIIGKLLF